MPKQMTKKANSELSADVLDIFAEDAGAGFEDMDQDSFAVPFLTVLQKMSPQVDETDGAYIDGAKPGMICNTITKELFDGKEGITVIACHYLRRWVEFVTRANGGGFVAEHTEPQPTTKDEANLDILENGNQLVDARNHYVIQTKVTGEIEPAVISMARTLVKASKQWNTIMRNLKKRDSSGNLFNPPTFASVFRLTTTTRQNEHGTWYIWNVAREGDVADMDTYQSAKLFKQQIQEGLATAAYDSMDGEASSDAQPEATEY